MTINELIKEIHENAVNHGWWESERSLSETLMLICSEWSEALEEARKDRPGHYYDTDEEHCSDCLYEPSTIICTNENCEYGMKPEGIAVELIDGVIRIFDLLGKENIYADDEMTLVDIQADIKDMQLCNLIHTLTYYVASCELIDADGIEALLNCVSLVCGYCARDGYDAETLLIEKHEYNKKRPYKHGKKF